MNESKPELENHVDLLREPFREFITAQKTASGLLIIVLVAALIIANSPWADALSALQHFPVGVILGDRSVHWSLLHFVNDGLIALFFVLIGLEVKRELLAGELSQSGRVGLLMGAAGGGMVAPALIYYGINSALPGGHNGGWGIPMATDTALAIGVLAALASRVPRSVVAFLVGVAIIDDIGAILVIALVYTEHLEFRAIMLAVGILFMLVGLNRAGFTRPIGYIVLGVALWIAILKSGLHASIAGVIVAATVPARPKTKPGRMRELVHKAVSLVPARAGHVEVLGEQKTHHRIKDVERLARRATTPLRRWEDGLELPVALLILPLFALLNAGVVIDATTMDQLISDPVAIGILAGLVIGKPLGLVSGVWVAQRLGLTRRPEELTNKRLLGVGMLAGIGFTMSTFIAHLAFPMQGETLDAAKLAILFASFIAAVCGYLVLRIGASSTTIENETCVGH